MEGEITEPEIDLNIEAGQGSKLKIVLLQNISESANLTLRVTCKLLDRSRIDFTQIHLGGSTVKSDITQVSKEPYSELNTYLMALTRKTQNYHFNLTNNYKALNGRGKILVKCVALDESRLTINGAIQITRKGSGTDSYLKQDCLLMSEKARINSIPALKIDTNKVKASHGASVTNINNESLFYLTSRGIDPKTARKMLITGFMAEVMDKVEDLHEVKEYILTNI